MSAVWIRLRQELRARWKGALGLGILLGVVFGSVVVSTAGARRTITAYDRYLDYARAEDYSVGLPNPQDPIFQLFMGTVSEFPEVAEVAPVASLEIVAADGSVGFFSLGGVDERFGRDVNRPKLTSGRSPDPGHADEILVNQAMADEHDLATGDEFVAFGLPGIRRQAPGAEPDIERDGRRQVFTVTGIAVFPNEVVATAPLDDLPVIYLTPAYVSAHVEETEEFGYLGIRLRPGPENRSAFRRHLEAFLADAGVPSSAVPLLEGTTRQATVNRAIQPQAYALYGFALLLGVTGVLVLGQAISRHLAADRDERATAWALGFSRPQLVGVSVMRVGVILAVGALVGIGVALVGSTAMPLGPAELAEPNPGVDVDWVVLVVGVSALFVIFSLWTVVHEWRRLDTPTRAGRPGRAFRSLGRPRVAEVVATTGAPPTAVAGVQMAFQPGGGSSLPTASAMVGTTVALAALVAAVTFGFNLDRLVETPRLYGWSWDVQVGGGFDGIPTRPAVRALEQNPAVEAFTGGNSTQIGFRPEGEDEAVQVPALGLDAIQGDVHPPLTQGRPVRDEDEVVLGASTMRDLGVDVGDQVTAELPGREDPEELDVVGQAVFPAIGAGTFATTGLGRGAIVAAAVLDDPEEPGTYTFFLLDYVAGTDRATADAQVQLAIEELIPDDCADLSCVAGARRPGEIRNYARVRGTPLALAGMLALLGAAVLIHTLVTGVRRHRRDLGLLASIGFVRRQIGATTAWQSTTVVVVSLVVGIPLGIALGRTGWTMLADYLGVVVQVEVPMLAILLAVPATIVAAIGIALIPALAAARTRPADALRAE